MKIKSGILIAVLAIIGITAIAMTTLNKIDVPQAVKNAFATKYSTAQKVEWEMEAANEYEAEFKLNGKEMSANFAADGTWLESETEIKERNLPQVIKDAITNQFPDYEIEEAEQIETPNLALGYEVELEHEDTDEELEAVFAADGTLLEKKAATDDEDKEDDNDRQ